MWPNSLEVGPRFIEIGPDLTERAGELWFNSGQDWTTLVQSWSTPAKHDEIGSDVVLELRATWATAQTSPIADDFGQVPAYLAESGARSTVVLQRWPIPGRWRPIFGNFGQHRSDLGQDSAELAGSGVIRPVSWSNNTLGPWVVSISRTYCAIRSIQRSWPILGVLRPRFGDVRGVAQRDLDRMPKMGIVHARPDGESDGRSAI